MYFLSRYRYVLMFLGVLAFSSIMVIHQMRRNQDRHVELREAFILLHSRGYEQPASRLFDQLVGSITSLSSAQLMDDFQRTVILVDPSIRNEKNLIWKYHWTVSNEMEKRSENAIKSALKLAGEEYPPVTNDQNQASP